MPVQKIPLFRHDIPAEDDDKGEDVALAPKAPAAKVRNSSASSGTVKKPAAKPAAKKAPAKKAPAKKS